MFGSKSKGAINLESMARSNNINDSNMPSIMKID